jgi:hypothetical protein
LLQHSTENAFAYFPQTEVKSFEGLNPVLHQNAAATIELSFRNKIFLKGSIFRKETHEEIFPLIQNGKLTLLNLADHRLRGCELEASVHTYAGHLSTSTQLSLTTARSLVTAVRDGFEGRPVAGFSNINIVIKKGQPLGVISGSSFLRDKENNRIIGSDGFPLVNTTPSVIGDPFPDFTLKLSHDLSWKRFSFNMDLQWKKGGTVWNGTAAVLNYFGRSEASARLRETKNYVFDGMHPDGSRNTTPVSFYDPALPFQQNRWVRYGHSGVGEEYIQPADAIRFNNIGFTYKIPFKKQLRSIAFQLVASNLVLWTAYKGADPEQHLYENHQAAGLDLFNLPSARTLGFQLTFQF